MAKRIVCIHSFLFVLIDENNRRHSFKNRTNFSCYLALVEMRFQVYIFVVEFKLV